MILVTGGLGFIGSHTTRALLDLGERCLVTRHRATEIPEFLAADLGEGLIVEPLDVEDGAAVRELGERHTITGIVHLADPSALHLWRRPGDPTPLRLDGLFDPLGHVLQAASEWGVGRVTVASTIGVYGGIAPGKWTEGSPLPMHASHAIPTAKKCTELLAAFIGEQLGLEVVAVRPSAIWGPRGRAASTFFALPALVHAAVNGVTDSTPAPGSFAAQDGADLCYVKDCGAAIAMIQTAEKLSHTVYNIGGGRVTTNAQVVGAIRASVPGFVFEMAEGRTATAGPIDPVLDLTRLQQDTGYNPAYDVETGIADYIDWLRAGHTS